MDQFLERIQRPHILQDIIHPPPKPKKKTKKEKVKWDNEITKFLNRTEERKAIGVAYFQCYGAALQLKAELRWIKHFPKCRRCQAELIINVERYMGSRLMWWLNLENEEYLPEMYPDIPLADKYHIGNYLDQVEWFRKHGNTDVPGENTYQFILDRAKFAYKIYGKQIHAAREMRRLLQKWDFSQTQHQEYLKLYEQLGTWQIIIPW